MAEADQRYEEHVQLQRDKDERNGVAAASTTTPTPESAAAASATTPETPTAENESVSGASEASATTAPVTFYDPWSSATPVHAPSLPFPFPFSLTPEMIRQQQQLLEQYQMYTTSVLHNTVHN